MREPHRVAPSLTDIAVVGMAGRFPGAPNTEQFWRNIAQGVESVSHLSDEELTASGVAPDVLGNAHFVRFGAVLDGIELFDAAFFGITPNEAAAMDPQHRLFLECAWEALENAGYQPTTCRGPVGVFAGAGVNTYVFNLYSQHGASESVAAFQAMLGNDKDYLSTRVSYKLGFEGPSLSVQTACSTSLVAVHLACQSLLSGECDTALAGGVSIRVPQKVGYLHQDGWILSPDGHCRAFDVRARGTVRGSGLGIVVLKRLVDALGDRDHIRAVIKGSAVNNDGALKVGYTAPSADGQTKVILAAHAVAGVSAESIEYLEAHGTGTELGDPIEVAALTAAFRASTSKRGFCALGSVKTNIGHLDAAAGIAGLLKAVYALEHHVLPPTLHFESPNPRIDFASSPFYVSTCPRSWEAGATPRRAGVSSFGIGGTNAHAVLEEAPPAEPGASTRTWQLATVSARTPSALERATTDLVDHLLRHPELNPADVAFTLSTGRRAFDHRRAAVGRDLTDLARALQTRDVGGAATGRVERAPRGVVFMFPGQGAQHPNMGRGLYESEPVYRDEVDRCAELLWPALGLDVRDMICRADQSDSSGYTILDRTCVAQPALFTVEYAAARLWMSWGIQPRAMVGYSLGEYVAACIAGVLTQDEALRLVALRGRLVQALPEGAMLAVLLPETELARCLPEGVSLAASNAPDVSVASGPLPAVEALRRTLATDGVAAQRLRTSHAFHSAMMDPVLADLTALAGELHPRSPSIPYLSNVTGTWMTAADAVDPAYWARHLRQTVRFSDALQALPGDPPLALLEVGPGGTLAALARRHASAPPTVLSTLPSQRSKRHDAAHALHTLGQLWAAGIPVDWQEFHARQQCCRVPLPTYPFEREYFWIERRPTEANPPSAVTPTEDRDEAVDRWLYAPTWNLSARGSAGATGTESRRGGKRTWLLFLDEQGVGPLVAGQLRERGDTVITVSRGDGLTCAAEHSYALDPRAPEQYRAVFARLRAQDTLPDGIVHLWSIVPGASPLLRLDRVAEQEERSLYSLLHLAQALGWEMPGTHVSIAVVTRSMQRAPGDAVVTPLQALALGPCRVIPLEYPALSCRAIDIDATDAETVEGVAAGLVAELTEGAVEPVVALRDGRRWIQSLAPVGVGAGRRPERTVELRIRDRGTYLITGGLGGIGLTVAEWLARTVRAHLVLVNRTPLPPRGTWEAYLTSRAGPDEVRRRIAAVRALEALGAEVMEASADVADAGGMRAVLARARERFGAIHGVVHAAGVAGAGMIQTKSIAAAAAVLAPKVRGTLVLDEVLRDTELDFFVECSSLSGTIGDLGQVDYCAANAFMDGFAQACAAEGRSHVVAIDWDRWREVGMALPPPGPTELLTTVPGESSRAPHPLLGRCVEELPDCVVFEETLHPASQWPLDEHRIGGTAVLPGTALLEVARAAVERVAGAVAVEIREAYFLSPVAVGDGEAVRLRTTVRRGREGWRVMIEGAPAPVVGSDRGWQEHARATLVHLSGPTGERRSIEALAERCGVPVVGDRGSSTWDTLAHSGPLAVGPRWQHLLRRLTRGEQEALATLELPDAFEADLGEYVLHPALLDAATGAAIGEYGLFQPFSYRGMRIHAPLPRAVYSHIRWDGDDDRDTRHFRITLMDKSGAVIVDIDDFTVRRTDGAPNHRAALDRPGVLGSLRMRPAERRAPGEREVEIAVRATGLNFRDVLLALHCADADGAVFSLGLECAGDITAVGAAVTDFAIGDAVVAVAERCFADYVTVPAIQVVRRPLHLTVAEAASIPIAFTTASYALHGLARLRAGERVLIHAATGGVGMAAVQIARRVGAEIFATAGTPEKRAFLTSLHIPHVFDSRTLAFAEGVMERTAGAGVDVVLNSLAGEFLVKSLEILAPFGRFLEIGKRDIRDNIQLALRPFERGLSFFAVDVGPRLPGFPDLLREVVRLFAEQSLEPSPCRMFPAERLADAFEYMAAARHIGKVVVVMREPRTGLDSHTGAPVASAAAGTGLGTTEGLACFRRILRRPLPQVIVSTRPIEERLANRRDLREMHRARELAAATGTTARARPTLANTYVPPQTDAERLYASLWQQVLGIERIGVNDNFFELGGTSIQILQVVASAMEAGVDLTPEMHFRYPTVAELAAASLAPLRALTEG